MKLLIIDNYDSFTYNLVQYFGELSLEPIVFRNDKITIEKFKEISPQRVVISPGPGNPCDERYFGICSEIIKLSGQKSIPVLGVCLGHQGIGYTFGGKIKRAGTLKHGKTSMIKHDGKGIFRDIQNPFRATRYHSLVVEEETLPNELIISARSEDDNEIMGLRHKEYNIQGIQCHPESILTESGRKLLMNFIEGEN
ncbi:MAG: aminodeoxychorismate/anthranilate synthase component II [Thaumarchaeota archaeon]|nr:aminodeoxychorismate/anthranilate synthase component II [Nitrososphaerota archaeon]|tara:strand:- start:9173 stop:9760 length:588 start_codon:yes stop_codon:yes gene_type:complete